MKSLILALFMIAPVAFAADTIILKTPRGADVNVTLHIPQGAHLPAVVVAPGQSCNSKGQIFETLGQAGFAEHVAVVRFEWDYCNSNPSQPTPSPELRNEIEDFQTVLEYARSNSSIDINKITIAGKSLGSIVAYSVFAKETEVKTLVLLTPVCSYTTDDNGNPLPNPLSVCEENYPKIKDDVRPVLMTMGNADNLCILPILYDFLKDSKGNIATVVAGGDHGLAVKDNAGNVDQVRTQNNIDAVVKSVLNWKAIND